MELLSPEPTPPEWVEPTIRGWSPLGAAASALGLIKNAVQGTIDFGVYFGILVGAALPIVLVGLYASSRCAAPARRLLGSAAGKWGAVMAQQQQQPSLYSAAAAAAGGGASGAGTAARGGSGGGGGVREGLMHVSVGGSNHREEEGER